MGLRRLLHVGFAVAAMEPSRAYFAEVLGAEVTEAVTDPIQKVAVCFASFDGGVVELVAPAGEGSPVDAVLKKRPGCYHLCFEVDDLDRTLAELRQAGCVPTSNPVPAEAFARRRICFVYSKLGQLMELVEAAPEP